MSAIDAIEREPSAARASATPRRLKPVLSFVRRLGRITKAQADARARHFAQYGIAGGDGAIDFDAHFGRRAPRVLEIGFGNGEQLYASASAEPDRDFIGIEVHESGIGQLLNRVAIAGLGNVAVIDDDAVEVLSRRIAPASLDEVRVLFPDPWPKARHHKRRLIQPAFLTLLGSRLAVGGRLHLATDWADYAEHMRVVIDGCAAFENLAGEPAFGPRPAWRVLSRFEARGLGLGHAVFDLAARRVG